MPVLVGDDCLGREVVGRIFTGSNERAVRRAITGERVLPADTRHFRQRREIYLDRRELGTVDETREEVRPPLPERTIDGIRIRRIARDRLAGGRTVRPAPVTAGREQARVASRKRSI